MSRLFFTFWLCLFATLGAQQPEEPTESTPIEVQDVASDDVILERIEKIYEAVGGFESIEVQVQSGVVTLNGTIKSEQLRKDAISLAKRTEGVVLTLDRLKEPAEITSQFAPAYEKVREMLETLIVKLPLIGAAILILAGAYFLGKIFSPKLGLLDRLKLSSMGKQLFARLAKLAIYLIAILLALELLDATAIVGAVVGRRRPRGYRHRLCLQKYR